MSSNCSKGAVRVGSVRKIDQADEEHLVTQDLAIWLRRSQSAGLEHFGSASASHVEAQRRAGGSVQLAALE